MQNYGDFGLPLFNMAGQKLDDDELDTFLGWLDVRLFLDFLAKSLDIGQSYLLMRNDVS